MIVPDLIMNRALDAAYNANDCSELSYATESVVKAAVQQVWRDVKQTLNDSVPTLAELMALKQLVPAVATAEQRSAYDKLQRLAEGA